MKSLFQLTIALLGIAFALQSTPLAAQTLQHRTRYQSQYFFQQMIYNPAYTGVDGQLAFGGAAQYPLGSQSVKPLSAHLFGQGRIANANDAGVGISASYYDFDDSFEGMILKLSGHLSYPFEILDVAEIRIGFAPGLIHYESLIAPGASSFDNPDAYVKFNMDMGVMLDWEDLQIGVAIQHANEPEFLYVGAGGNSAFLRRVTYASASYDIGLSNGLHIIPNLFFNQNFRTGNILLGNDGWQADLGAMFHYNEKYWFGYQYKLKDEVSRMGFMLGSRLGERFHISLNYDLKNGNSFSSSNRVGLTIGLTLPTLYRDLDEEDLEE